MQTAAEAAAHGWSSRRTFRPAGPVGTTKGVRTMQIHVQSVSGGCRSSDDAGSSPSPAGLLGFPDHARFALLPSQRRRSAPSGTGPADGVLPTGSRAPTTRPWRSSWPTPAMFFKRLRRSRSARTRPPTCAVADAGHAPGSSSSATRSGDWITGNLLGPVLVVNAEPTSWPAQVVLTERKWTTRQPLVRVTTGGGRRGDAGPQVGLKAGGGSGRSG